MNLAQNTPGYSERLTYVFTLLNGVPRAWMLSELAGHAVLVPLAFETCRRWVEQGLADERVLTVPPEYGRSVPLVELVQPAGCGCLHPSTPEPWKRTSPVGRLAEGTVGEPLLAVAEGGATRVVCCGSECDGTAEGTPSGVRFDRFAVAEDGGFERKESAVTPFPSDLIELYKGRQSRTCLPWVRITRDPKRFEACMDVARRIGPMDNPKRVVQLVGKHLAAEDQEVFLVILVDGQLQVRGISEMARGARDNTAISVPDTLRVAIVDGATGIIVVHNHPSGVPYPSEADKKVTEVLREAAHTVRLELMDHVIIAGAKFYSFAERGPWPREKRS
jgi:DNA repair protein RadC